MSTREELVKELEVADDAWKADWDAYAASWKDYAAAFAALKAYDKENT